MWMDCARSGGNLGGVLRVRLSRVAVRGRKTYLGDGCTSINVVEVIEVVSKRRAPCWGIRPMRDRNGPA